MEDSTFPSIGASFKKWEYYIPILSKGLAHFPKFPPKKNFQSKFFKKNGPQFGRAVARCPKFTLCKKKFLPPTLLFLHMWSILANCLQYMLA